MEISKKIQHGDEFELRLYKEGIFWTAYEQSAYAIVRIKPYKVTKKFVKVIEQEVVSVGFPQSSLENLTVGMIEEVKEDTLAVFRLTEAVDPEEFRLWKEALPLTAFPEKLQGSRTTETFQETSNQAAIISRLKAFSIANATPVECMLFLSELQKMS